MSLSDDDVNYYVDDGWLDESCCVGSTMSQSLDGSGCDDSQDYGSQPLPEPLPALTENELALLEAQALVANCKREAAARKEKIVQQAMQAKKAKPGPKKRKRAHGAKASADIVAIGSPSVDRDAA